MFDDGDSSTYTQEQIKKGLADSTTESLPPVDDVLLGGMVADQASPPAIDFSFTKLGKSKHETVSGFLVGKHTGKAFGEDVFMEHWTMSLKPMLDEQGDAPPSPPKSGRRTRGSRKKKPPAAKPATPERLGLQTLRYTTYPLSYTTYCILHPAPCILHPTPTTYTCILLHPAFCIQHATTCTLHSTTIMHILLTTYILHPTILSQVHGHS